MKKLLFSLLLTATSAHAHSVLEAISKADDADAARPASHAAGETTLGLRAPIPGTTGATSQLQYKQAGTGSIARSLTSKLQESISVKDFGARGDGVTDDSIPFQNAVNALPASGGAIVVPDSAYVVNTPPTWGAKSVEWRFGPAATVAGKQTTFPRMNTNRGQVPVGPWVQSQSSVPSPTGGGIAAGNFEMLQPSNYNGQSVALYAGARGSSPTGNVWAINPLIQADAGAGGTYQNIEVDVNNFSKSALVKGISINGVGSVNPQVALEVMRTGAGPGASWVSGINVHDSITGIVLNSSSGKLKTGVSIGSATGMTADVQAQQLANGGDVFFGARATDKSPSGNFLRLVNAANTINLFQVDASGNLTGGILTGLGSADAGASFLATQNNSSASVLTKYAGIEFRGRDTASSIKTTASIRTVPADVNVVSAGLAFLVRNADAVSEQARLTHAGNLLIGTTTDDSTNRLQVHGNAAVKSVGFGLRVAEGANAKQLLSPAMTAGSVTIANTSVTANSRIICTRQPGGTNPGAAMVTAITAGASFVVTSTNAADTGRVACEIFEPG